MRYPSNKHELQRKIGRTVSTQDVLLAGMLSKENLLDVIRNFIVFDRDGGKIVRRLHGISNSRPSTKRFARLSIRRVSCF